MVSRGFTVFLALLRIAAGVSLILAGLTKLSWFQSSAALQQTLAKWSAGASTPMVARYLSVVTQHVGLFARLVVLGELGLGALLLVGFLTPLAALLAFLMVLNFSVASSQILGKQFYAAPGSLVYLLSFLVIFAGKGGTALGVDGLLAGRKQRAN